MRGRQDALAGCQQEHSARHRKGPLRRAACGRQAGAQRLWPGPPKPHPTPPTYPPYPAAVVSMGTEVSEDDVLNILALCDQVIALAEYRAQVRGRAARVGVPSHSCLERAAALWAPGRPPRASRPPPTAHLFADPLPLLSTPSNHRSCTIT